MCRTWTQREKTANNDMCRTWTPRENGKQLNTMSMLSQMELKGSEFEIQIGAQVETK